MSDQQQKGPCEGTIHARSVPLLMGLWIAVSTLSGAPAPAAASPYQDQTIEINFPVESRVEISFRDHIVYSEGLSDPNHLAVAADGTVIASDRIERRLVVWEADGPRAIARGVCS